MPYASVSELPAQVRNSLPAKGQEIFLAAFNSAYKQYDGDEAKVNAVAWAAVKQMFEKNEKGEWVRKAVDNLSFVSFDNAAEFTGLHDITLQTLDTRHPHPSHEDGIYYSADNFAGTERDWESKDLVVFVPPGKKVQHVDHAAFSNDPIGEAKRLGYRIAGRLNNTRIQSGVPRVDSTIEFTDPEAEKFASRKQLSLSSAFDAAIMPDGKMSGKVVPNHVLLFLKCAGKSDGFCGIPNDKGARFNNLSEDHEMADEEIKSLTQSVKDLIGLHKENPLQATVDNLTAEIGKKDEQIKALTIERDAFKADKEAMDNLRAQEVQAKKDAQWGQVKNLYKPAMFHKQEDEAARRAEFEADPVGFQLANVGNLAVAEEKAPVEGKTAVGNLDSDGAIDMVAERGAYDPITHTFKGRV